MADANRKRFEDVRAPLGFGVVRVRGPPGPHWSFAPGPEWRTRTASGSRTSAHLQNSACWGCADLPVRIGVRTTPECGRGRPRTSQCPACGCADLPVRIGVRARPECGRGRPRTSQCSACGVRGPPGPHRGSHHAGMRTRTSAHLPVFGVRGARTSRSALGLVPGRNADEDVRAPPSVRRGGARTSRSALGFVARPECGRGRPRTSQCSACGVRGPPGPHWRPCPAPRPHSMTTSSETAPPGSGHAVLVHRPRADRVRPRDGCSSSGTRCSAPAPASVARRARRRGAGPRRRGAPSTALQRPRISPSSRRSSATVAGGGSSAAGRSPSPRASSACDTFVRCPDGLDSRLCTAARRSDSTRSRHLRGAVAECAGRDRVVLARLELGGRQLHRVGRGHQHPHGRAGTQPQVVGAARSTPPPRARSGSPAAARSCGGWCRD